MKFFQTAILLSFMVSVVSTVAAQTPQPVKKACCAPGSTTDAAGKKCDPKACAPQTGSAKACCAQGSTTDAAGKKCDPKACAPQTGSAKACCAQGSTTDASGKKCDPKACAPQTGSAKACCATTNSSASSNATAYEPREFKKQFKQAKNKVLLDVRTPEEFA